MMLKFKEKTNLMLNKLYKSANRFHLNSKKKNKTNFKRMVSRMQNQNLMQHFSSLDDLQVKKKFDQQFVQYRYKNFNAIKTILYDLAKKYPDYLQVTTAQQLYGLPYPGGYCDLQTKA